MNSNFSRLHQRLYETSCIMVPRYKLWLSRSYWQPFEAALLFNGVDPVHSSGVVELKRTKEGEISYNICFLEQEDVERYWLKENGCSLIMANRFLEIIIEEACAIATWEIPRHPLILTNRYLQKIEDIPRKMLKSANQAFLELYKRRNDNDKIRKYWDDNWRHNIAGPFLQLIANEDDHIKKEESEQSKINQMSGGAHTAKQNHEEEKVKIISEESAEARRKRICNRGYELYKVLKEQHPNKKITKENIAEQIIKEEEPLYKLITAKNPLKKQPALGTYLKELRKIH